MKKPKEPPLVLRDSQDLRNLIIQVNLQKGTTIVFSSFTPWENLAYIMEALAVTARMCTEEGIEKEKVDQAISRYLVEVMGNCHILTSKTHQ